MSDSFFHKRKVILIILGILAMGAGAWGVVGLTKGKKTILPKELSVESLKANAQDPAKLMDQVHQAMNRDDLTEEQRHELFENLHEVRETQMNQRLDEYFSADENQRQAILDRQIDEMQTHMREWQQRRAQADQAGGNRGEQNRRPGDFGPRPGPDAGNATNTGGPDANRRGDRRGPPTQAQRKLRSESRDPDQQARRMAYFTALRKRAQERGIELPGPRGMGRP